MTLGPDKTALTVLYYLDSVSDAADESSAISNALGGVFTANQVRAALDHLQKLGLVVDAGPMPMGIGGKVVGGAESWAVTRDGGRYVHRCIQKPSSFIGRLHAKGLLWLTTEEARKAKLTTQLDRYSVEEVLDEGPSPPISHPAVHIHNTFSPTNTVTPTQSVTQTAASAPDPYSKSAARAGWINVWVALIIGLAAIVVALWLAGKIGS